MPRPSSSIQYNNQDRVVIVTGGGQGIGLAICLGFARSNATVVVADINEELVANLPETAHFKQCDTSRQQDCERVVSETIREFGGIDVLVNNASIQPPESYVPIDQLDDGLYEKMLAINFSGYTWMGENTLFVR